MIRMRRLRLTFLLTLLCSLLLLNTTAASAAGTPPIAAIEAFVEERMHAAKIPGLALAIVQGDQVVHVQGFGSAGEGRPVTPDTPFIIGSVSKSFTALAIMQLVEAGKVDLDAPVQRYIPWFSLKDQAHAQAVTVRHLLNMTSGISTSSWYGMKLTPESTLESVVRQMESVAPTEAVGTTYQYANLNYISLGLIVELVSGQSYGDYLQDHIFTPLGMSHSTIDLDLAVRDGLSSGHQRYFGFPIERTVPVSPANIPAGYIVSSAADMGRYLQALMQGGGGILSAKGVDELHRGAVVMGPKGGEYAMGWRRGTNGGVEVIHHPGNTETFTSHAVIAADKSWSFVLLANSVEGLATDYKAIVDGVAGLLAGKDAPKVGFLRSGRFYQIVDFVLAGILLWQLWAVGHLGAWRGRRSAWTYLRIAGNLALGGLVFWGVPMALDIPLSAHLTFTPDPSYLVVGIAVLGLLLGVGRLVMITRPRSQPLRQVA